MVILDAFIQSHTMEAVDVPEQKDVDKLTKLNEKIGLNIAGEGGEFESLVIDGPIFKKKLAIKGKIKMESENTGRFTITKAELK